VPSITGSATRNPVARGVQCCFPQARVKQLCRAEERAVGEATRTTATGSPLAPSMRQIAADDASGRPGNGDTSAKWARL
jgi:hypothetical protein